MTTLFVQLIQCMMYSSNVLKIKMMSILLQKDYFAAQKYPAMWTLILNFCRNINLKQII